MNNQFVNTSDKKGNPSLSKKPSSNQTEKKQGSSAFVKLPAKAERWKVGIEPNPSTIEVAHKIECVAISLGCSDRRKDDYVIHRAIGASGLDPDDWVLSSVTAFRELLDRQDDPDKARLQAARSQYVNAACIESGVLVPRDGLLFYGGLNTIDRKKALNILKDEEKGEKPLSSFALLVKGLEDQLSEFKRNARLQEKAEERFPSYYSTCSGPLSDQYQDAISDLKGYNLAQVRSAIPRMLAGLQAQKYKQSGPGTSTGSVSNRFDRTFFDPDSSELKKLIPPLVIPKDESSDLKPPEGATDPKADILKYTTCLPLDHVPTEKEEHVNLIDFAIQEGIDAKRLKSGKLAKLKTDLPLQKANLSALGTTIKEGFDRTPDVSTSDSPPPMETVPGAEPDEDLPIKEQNKEGET